MLIFWRVRGWVRKNAPILNEWRWLLMLAFAISLLCRTKYSQNVLSQWKLRPFPAWFYRLNPFRLVCIYLGSLCAKFQEKIFPETSGKKFQTFHCNVTAMKSLELFQGRFREYFFLKIGIRSPKVYTKKPPQQSMWLHPCPVQNFIYQASHCSALEIGWLNLCSRV